MGKRLLLTLGVLLSLSALTGSIGTIPEIGSAALVDLDEPEVSPDADLLPFVDHFEQFVSLRLEEEEVPGVAIAIVRDSNIIYLNTFGKRESAGYQAVDWHSVFRLASVSKGFAPVLTGILVEKGIVDWDDRVVDYLPDFALYKPSDTEALTLRHVLSHTTGLPRHAYTNLLDDGVPYPKIRQKLRTVPLSHRIGTFYNYQNVAYSLIGDVLEKATGKTYTELLREHIFEPLKMKDASASYQEIVNHDNVAFPHSRRGGDYAPIEISPNYYDAAPAAGVNASIADMARWLKFLLGNRPDVLSQPVLDEVFTPFVDISTRDKVLGNWRHLIDRAHYALGWRVLRGEGRTIVYHGGYVNGYRSEIALMRESRIGIAVLTNAPSRFISDCIPSFFEMFFDYQQKMAGEALEGDFLTSR